MKNNLKYVLIVLILVWMGVIFLFSNQTATTSQNLSDEVSVKIIETGAKITNKSYTKTEKKKLINKMRFAVRKSAHFFLYFVLAILFYLLAEKLNISKKTRWILLGCLLYAISDELHQYFINERTAKIFDIFIDFMGSLAGICLCKALYRLKNQKNVKKCLQF